MTEEYNVADFVYVETAFGGQSRRNKVAHIDEVANQNIGQKEMYISHNRFDTVNSRGKWTSRCRVVCTTQSRPGVDHETTPGPVMMK